MAEAISFRERFVDAPIEAVGNSQTFQTYARLLGVVGHGGQAAAQSAFSLVDYRTYLHAAQRIGPASAKLHWIALGPGALESRSPALAHPLQTWNQFIQHESQAAKGTYLDLQAWRTNPINAFDSLAVSTGAVLPQGVLLAYGLAPEAAAFEVQNAAWAKGALRVIDRGFENIVPPPAGVTPTGAVVAIPVVGEGMAVAVVGAAGFGWGQAAVAGHAMAHLGGTYRVDHSATILGKLENVYRGRPDPSDPSIMVEVNAILESELQLGLGVELELDGLVQLKYALLRALQTNRPQLAADITRFLENKGHPPAAMLEYFQKGSR